MRTKKLTHLRNILLWILKHMCRLVMRRVHFHRAKLMKFEIILLVFPNSFLCKKNWPWVVNIYCNSNKKENGREGDEVSE